MQLQQVQTLTDAVDYAAEAVSLDELIDWLRDRRANCERLARAKIGEDQAGWLEDAAYFAAALSALAASPASEKEHGDGH